MSDKLTEMWAAFEAHKPKRSYTNKAWKRMCKERTRDAAEAASVAAEVTTEVTTAEMAAWSAAKAVAASERAAELAAMADRYAQDAIDALKQEVKP